MNRVYAVELRDIWRHWLDQNAHLTSCSFQSKSLLDVSVDAEIEHLLQAMSWKTELKCAQYATPQLSREAYKIILDTEPLSSEKGLFANMGGCESR
jgi:hypothetical protein